MRLFALVRPALVMSAALCATLSASPATATPATTATTIPATSSSTGVATPSWTVTSSTLNVRSGPSTGYTRLGTLVRGDLVGGTRLSSGWVRFTYKGRTAYVSGAYLRQTSTASSTLTAHARPGYGLEIPVFSHPVNSSTYRAHYVARGGIVRGTVEGSWLRMTSNRWARLTDLTTNHTTYDGTNGRHSPSLLCAMQGSAASGHVLLACPAVAPLKGLNEAYRARFGSSLPWDECYRTYDTQVAYRSAFGTKAAVPGYSNHGSVTRPACDVPEQSSTFGFGTTRYNWLIQNGPRFGWVHPSWAKPWGTNPEYWHFEYAG